MGKTLVWNSFKLNGTGDPFGTIDFNSTENMDFINETTALLETVANEDGNLSSLVFYMKNAGNGKMFDFKGGLPEEQYRGSLLAPGVYGTARDAGNYVAGIAGRISGLPLNLTLRGTGAFNAAGNPSLTAQGATKIMGQFINHLFKGAPYGELPISSTVQALGWLSYY
jgi:hypothetical protein